MGYRLFFTQRAVRDLDALEPRAKRRIGEAAKKSRRPSDSERDARWFTKMRAPAYAGALIVTAWPANGHYRA